MSTKDHKELWLEIAEAFGTAYRQRNKRQLSLTVYVFHYEKITTERTGLCWAWSQYENSIFENAFAPDNNCDFWWPRDDEGDAQRCLFACFMAAMSEDDYSEMVEAV